MIQTLFSELKQSMRLTEPSFQVAFILDLAIQELLIKQFQFQLEFTLQSSRVEVETLWIDLKLNSAMD